MPITDIVTLILSIFLLARGASRGFLHSLIGPFSIIIATLISIVYYQVTHDTLTSLLIGLFGPILLNLTFKFMLNQFAPIKDFIKNVTNTTHGETKPNFLSRLAGALMTLIWGWVFIIFTILLLAVLPPWGKALTALHTDVTKSVSFAITRPLGGLFFKSSKQNIPMIANADPNAELKSLSDNPEFQKVMQDPSVQQEINAHDIIHLMSNPQILSLTQQLMNDPDTMKKVMDIYARQAQAHQNP